MADIKEFEPGVIEYEDADVTEVVIEDCPTIWRELGSDGIGLGYDHGGHLVAVRIPGLVANANLNQERSGFLTSVPNPCPD